MKKAILFLIPLILIGFITSGKVLGQQEGGWDMAITPFAHLYESSEDNKADQKKQVQSEANKKDTSPNKQAATTFTASTNPCNHNKGAKASKSESSKTKK